MNCAIPIDEGNALKNINNPEPDSHIEEHDADWQLRLYVAGKTPRSMAAFANLKRICETYLKGKYTIDVVDLLMNPLVAKDEQILAVPSLVRQSPPPAKNIIGDLANEERVIASLELLPRRTHLLSGLKFK